MNTPTLSQLADIGAKAAQVRLLDEGDDTSKIVVRADHSCYTADAQARKAFAKAVLDAVGYKFPVDPEREAFDAWYQTAQIPQGETQAFAAWKAGRDELRLSQELAKEPAITDPPWIEWKGGKCPIPDTVRRWEYRLRGGYQCSDPGGSPSAYDWEGKVALYQVVAYRILDWGTTKQPE